ncbi:MAG TPA: alpha/beta fold hydrolase [Candidatus Limnocylindria bacterium]|jgi:pimeloyl-ACP methyl ester carboxylesterase
MDVRVKTISVMGLRTRVLESGDASRGDPVVMIHGVGGWAENFREVMEPTAHTGRRAFAVDLPGFGESETPSRVPYFGPKNAFYPQFIISLLDELKLSTAHLVGSSMGGAVAYMTAVTAPERVRSLTLVASGGLGTDIALFLRLATLPGAIALARLLGDRHQSREVLRSCFFDASRIPETLYEESERFGFRSYPEFVRALRQGVSIFGVKRKLREHWMARASRYRGPVLAVWGREDAVLPISHVADANAVFPQADVRIIERCGHLPMIERTDEFLAAFLPFVEDAETAAAA